MITAEEARQLSFKATEEKCSIRLKVIADRIKKACENGENNLCIVNARERRTV